MAQPQLANVNGINCTDPEHTRTVSTSTNEEASSQHQPNVRHIPIFVEGRDEPLLNNIIEPNINNSNRPTAPINDIPITESIFSRVKDIPVRKVNMGNQTSNISRSVSPGRNIPISVIHTKSHKEPSKQQQQQQQQQQQETKEEETPQPPPPAPVIDPIEKIQKIQQEVLELMDKVEKFKGGSRSDKEYIYLDEMLTQNLLKLDTIDTEGKENIKAARKEAIKCINKCISVLEAKTDAVEKTGKIDTEKVKEPKKSQSSTKEIPESNNPQPIVDNPKENNSKESEELATQNAS